MGDEPYRDPDGHFTRREWEIWSEGHDREHQLLETAIEKAERAMERRLEGMNEFRQQLNLQAGTFVTREAFDISHKALERRMGLVENWRSGIDGRTIGVAAALSGITFLATLFLWFSVR